MNSKTASSAALSGRKLKGTSVFYTEVQIGKFVFGGKEPSVLRSKDLIFYII